MKVFGPTSGRYCLLLALLAVAPWAHAWGAFGHRTVGYIAQSRLTPQAASAISRILGPGITLADVAPWADTYRAQARRTSRWHYIDLPIEGYNGDYERYCPKHACVVDQIIADERTLADPRARLSNQQKALKFLVHFVGDIHQPLHCANDDDRGGNEKKVVFTDPDGNAIHTSLHHLWDSMVGVDVHGGPQALASRLEGAITPALAAQWSHGTPLDWANQSYEIAKNDIYRGLSPGRTASAIRLPSDYAQKMDPVVREQLERAGARLAWVLNQLYAH